jgi:hypothetical protein
MDAIGVKLNQDEIDLVIGLLKSSVHSLQKEWRALPELDLPDDCDPTDPKYARHWMIRYELNEAKDLLWKFEEIA